jgi:hypothetical protein
MHMAVMSVSLTHVAPGNKSGGMSTTCLSAGHGNELQSLLSDFTIPYHTIHVALVFSVAASLQ